MFIHDVEKERSLWDRYQSGDGEAFRRLVEYYHPFAAIMAKKQYKLFGFSNGDYDDFLQNASIGLMDALHKFDNTKGVEFLAYASIRIKGEILNGLKQLSEKNSYYAYVQRIKQERIDAIVEENEMAGKNAGLEQVGSMIIELAFSYMLEELVELGVEIRVPATPYQICMLSELKRSIAQYIERLPDKEKLIIRWHYFEWMTFQEISELLGVTKGRVSQLHHKGLTRLKALSLDQKELIA